MFEQVYGHILASFSNQFFAGGAGLMLLGAIAIVLRKIPSQLWNLFLRYGTVVVDVQSTESIYDWLLGWLDNLDYGKSTRRASLKQIVSKGGKRKTILVPSKGNHWFIYKGRPLWLMRFTDKDAAGTPGGLSDLFLALNPKETISIRIVGRSRDIINNLVEEARTLYETATDDDLLSINRYQWGSWLKRRKAKRPLESIMLPPDATDLINDVKNFINKGDWYRTMGIPYRRGYLFHGPPGTGKSSTVEALAGALDIPLYILNLAGLSDDSLMTAMANMNHEGVAILLIEDVDTVPIQRDATKDKQNLSLGTLLNAIDGVQAADSVILVMTTNHPQVLDAALTRKGRVDRQVEFGLATEDQINQAVRRFIPNTTLEQCREIASWSRPISMAEVQEHLKGMVLDRKYVEMV